MQVAKETMVGLTMRFEVVVDDMDLGGWASCKGLKVDFNLAKIDEGGTNTHSYWLPDRVSYEKIVLSRAMTQADSARLAGWLSSCVDKADGGTAKITLQDAHAKEISSWSLRNVMPFSWQGPELDASGSARVAVETLTLVHEGFL